MTVATGAPIFVHSSFRVSSTWFFTRLRAIPNARVYYEIFHERLSDLTPNVLSTFGVNSWNSGHPDTAPYFEEFRELLVEGGGVRGFSPELPYERFVPKDGAFGDISEPERRYVGLLIQAAGAHGQSPILTCGRTLVRAAGLKRAFGGRHVLLLRDLYPQWMSYVRNAASGASYYFMTATLQCLLNARGDAFLGQVFESHVIKHRSGEAFQMVRFPDLTRFLEAFVALHVYAYMAAYCSADVVINVSDVAFGRRSARDAEAEFLSATGLAIDLTGCRETEEAAPAALGVLSEAFCMWTLNESAAALRIDHSHAAYAFVAQMLDRLILAFRGQ